MVQENHAHDIYDLFHSIHKTAVKKATFYTWEDMISIIRNSHSMSLRFWAKQEEESVETSETTETPKVKRGRWFAPAGSSNGLRGLHDERESQFGDLLTTCSCALSVTRSQGKCPAMGPDVLVSNLWQVRDFWDWMIPGYWTSAQDPTACVCECVWLTFSFMTHSLCASVSVSTVTRVPGCHPTRQHRVLREHQSLSRLRVSPRVEGR